MLALAASAAAGIARRALDRARALLYAGYFWTVFGLAASIVWPAVVLLPRRRWRWRVLRAAARALLALVGARIEASGEPPAAEPGVIVANHASYLDSLLLAGLVSGEPVFAAKAELASQRFAGLFVRRLGGLFVERFDPAGGTAAVEPAVGAARAGRQLIFFPEGTLTRRPGLADFRLGAFVVAARAGVSVTPVAIRGTRTLLRGDQWFPRRAALSVHFGRPRQPHGSDWQAALALRDAAREAILARCGEPDLGGEEHPLLHKRALHPAHSR